RKWIAILARRATKTRRNGPLAKLSHRLFLETFWRLAVPGGNGARRRMWHKSFAMLSKGARQCPERAPPTQRKHMENASETRTTKPQRKLGHMLAIFKDLFAKLSPPLWLTIREVKNTPAGDEPLIVNGQI